MICKDLILRKWSWCLMFKLLAVFGVSYYEAGWVRCVVGEPVMYESGHVSSGMLAAYTSDRSVQQNDVVKMDNLNDKFYLPRFNHRSYEVRFQAGSCAHSHLSSSIRLLF